MKVLDVENIPIVSVNRKYIKGRNGRLILSREYREFKNNVAKLCRKCAIEKPYIVNISYSGRNDIDNSIKPILDALEFAGVLCNDKYVHELRVRKIPAKHTRLIVEVETMQEVA